MSSDIIAHASVAFSSTRRCVLHLLFSAAQASGPQASAHKSCSMMHTRTHRALQGRRLPVWECCSPSLTVVHAHLAHHAYALQDEYAHTCTGSRRKSSLIERRILRNREARTAHGGAALGVQGHVRSLGSACKHTWAVISRSRQHTTVSSFEWTGAAHQTCV